MDVKISAGFAIPVRQTIRKSVPKTAVRAVPQEQHRDTVQLTGYDVMTVRKDGFIEVRGQKFTVSEEISKQISATYERAEAHNQMKLFSEEMQRNAEASAQQMKAISEQAKAMAKALEIYRRIADGGRVPPEDERFLQEFSQELYLAAKTAAMMAERHEDYDSVLEDEREEESGADGAAKIDTSVECVEVGVSDGAVASVSTVSVDASALTE